MRTNHGVAALLGLALLASMVAPDDAIAQAADASPLKHFEFSAPPDGPWQVDRSTSGMGSVTYLHKEGGALYQITLLENVVLNPEFRKATAAWVADDFRAAERAGMEELGAGQYRLRDVQMGEETLGGKVYYTMSYVTEAGGHYQRARLYLHFPQASDNEYFLVAHYSETARRRSDLKSSHEADFRLVLENVTHRPDKPAPAAPVASEPVATSAQRFMSDFIVAHAMTQTELPRSRLKIRCQAKVEGAYVSLIETPETGVGWVAFTAKRFSDPGRNMLTRMQMPGERRGPTMDWGYVLDRDRDGRADYVAFLYGTACVAPEKCEQPLPSVTGGTLTPELVEIITRNIRLVFWHVTDDNADDRVDGATIPLVTEANGWIEGWLVTRDADFDGSFEECRHFAGLLATDLGACEGSPDGYSVPGRRPGGLRQVPPRDESFLRMINEAVKECGLPAGSLRSLQ